MDWDDMLDAKYVDESGYAMYGDEEEDDGDDAGAYAYLYCDSGDWREVSLKQRNYTILKEGAVRQRLDACMSSVSWALSIPRDSAFKLLRHVNRSIRNVDEAQIAGEDEVCKALGALGISTKAKTAEGGEIKWCPAPGCDCAIEFLDHGSGAGYDVTCSCSYNFCWNCGEEAHRPVDCETVSEWIKKKSAESENMKLILADSKPCPQCKRPVEKSQGGRVHMICSPPCKNEFCWVCLGEWSDHTGGLYACNRYEGAHDESLRRYAHYYERWATHESSRQKAVADLQQVQTVDLPRLGVKFWEPELALQFILEAWLQVVECRRVLKWSYVYGYYLPEQAVAKRHLLEYLQGEAEVALERLHQCADKAFHTYLDASQDDTDNNFRSKLAGLTKVTRNYFDNLVSALEKGLSEVRTHGATSEGKGPTEGVGGRQMCLTDKDAPDNQLC